MKQLLEPLLGLDDTWPDVVVVARTLHTGLMACYVTGGVHGVAAFSDGEAAREFVEMMPERDEDFVLLAVSFDDARVIAQQRPMPCVSLILLDDIANPVIHYVR